MDHRLRLFLDVEVFADAQEEFQCCIKVCASLGLLCVPRRPECPLCPPQPAVSAWGLRKHRVRRPVSAPAVALSVAVDTVLDVEGCRWHCHRDSDARLMECGSVGERQGRKAAEHSTWRSDGASCHCSKYTVLLVPLRAPSMCKTLGFRVNQSCHLSYILV